jgi:orotidine-5'-phosphate decarboxylase
MKRKGCDYIVFPLDVPDFETATKFVRILAGHVAMFKVGLELFIQSGLKVIDFIHQSGSTPIFLDLKLHDIPATVGRAMARIADLGVAYTTIHCAENKTMLEAAVEGAQGKVKVLGVTVLTSVSGGDLKEAGFKTKYSGDVDGLVLKRAAMAQDAGCAGIVCSGREVQQIKSRFGADFCAVTPGIRPAWDVAGKDDQKRLTTPAQAVKSGSDYIVIGRPIRDADDPVTAAKRVAAEIDDM